jgi:hypothetical protein
MKGTRRIAARISSALFAINVVRDGAEPKTKREGSADLTWWFNSIPRLH